MNSKASLLNPKSLKFACHAKPSGVSLLARVPGVADPGVADPWHRLTAVSSIIFLIQQGSAAN